MWNAFYTKCVETMEDMANNNAETAEPVQMSAVDIQQQYYEAMGDADWELYGKKERHLLLQKVALALCGPPTGEGNLANFSNSMELQGYPNLRDKETVMTVFRKICEQAKYSHNGKDIIISVLRVLCVIPTREIGTLERTPDDYWLNLHVKRGKENVTILVFHVFGIRKCISMKSGVKCCRKFIDHDGRVYKNWTQYLTNNKLPKCVMVVPRNGEYRGELQSVVRSVGAGNDTFEMPVVQLTVVQSPALGIGAKILDTADKASIGLTIGSLAGIAGAAVLAPVALPAAMGTALVVGVGAGIYSIARSTMNLTDRSKHEQDIDLSNSESRACWINIAISTVGLSFTAAGKLLSWAAASGTSVEILMNAVQVLKYTNNFTSAIGVINGIGEMAYKYTKYGEQPTMSECFSVSVSALFFGIGVMSNQTAKDIVQDAQAERINSVRDSLASNNKRKIFDKVTAETRRLKGNINGNADVIRALDKIDNKDEFFAKLGRINKQINKNKMRISLTPDANTLVNNEYSASLSNLYELGKDGRNKLFTELGPAKMDSKNVPTRIYRSTNSNLFSTTATDNASGFNKQEILKITAFLITLSKRDKEFIAEVLSDFTKKIHDGFLLLCAEIVSALLPQELKFIKEVWSDFEIHLVLFVSNYLKKCIPDCNDSDNAFVALMKEFIRNGKIVKETILELKKKFLDKVTEIKNNFYDDPYKYTEFQTFRSNHKQFLQLRAGHVIKLGNHDVLVKSTTIDMFETRLENYDQLQCDLLTAVIFKIVGLISKPDAKKLQMTNPDQDLIMRVSQCIFEIGKLDVLVTLLVETESGVTNADIAHFLRDLVLIWCSEQKTRRHYTCRTCKGIMYAT